ncbi:hypothetical protein [Streptomyces sp. NPDC088196]|uniref:hypothetical protein n=1 Tax=Streptomyces sp. NPDC088196 TaxID=3154868 RepID=UPI00344B3087
MRRRTADSEHSGARIVIDQDAVVERREFVVRLGGADGQDVGAGGGSGDQLEDPGIESCAAGPQGVRSAMCRMTASTPGRASS